MSPTPSRLTPTAIDPTQCPLCGQANRCAMEVARETGAAQPPCWCMGATFPPSLHGNLPAKARGKACVCASCAAKALAEENTA